jgi:hypothetical protein
VLWSPQLDAVQEYAARSSGVLEGRGTFAQQAPNSSKAGMPRQQHVLCKGACDVHQLVVAVVSTVRHMYVRVIKHALAWTE